jgi:hypothetical protein
MATPLSPEEALARAKLRALAQGVQVWILESGQTPRYAVPSTSMDGTAYEVVVHNRDAGYITCNCKGGENGRYCKHQGAVLLRLDVNAEMELAQARAAEDREREAA